MRERRLGRPGRTFADALCSCSIWLFWIPATRFTENGLLWRISLQSIVMAAAAKATSYAWSRRRSLRYRCGCPNFTGGSRRALAAAVDLIWWVHCCGGLSTFDQVWSAPGKQPTLSGGNFNEGGRFCTLSTPLEKMLLDCHWWGGGSDDELSPDPQMTLMNFHFCTASDAVLSVLRRLLPP